MADCKPNTPAVGLPNGLSNKQAPKSISVINYFPYSMFVCMFTTNWLHFAYHASKLNSDVLPFTKIK